MRTPDDPPPGGSFHFRAGTSSCDAMKLLLPLAALATLALAACGEEPRPAASHAELRAANQNAAAEAEKSFDKENPADPAALK